MQPPDISGLGPTYRMFGQVVQNPSHVSNAQFPAPPIDKDVLMYDSKKPVKQEIIRLIDTLPSSTLALLKAIQNTPNDSNKQLRDFDNRIKSLFHALEVLRPAEARETILRISQQEVRIREEMNDSCGKVVEDTINLVGYVAFGAVLQYLV